MMMNNGYDNQSLVRCGIDKIALGIESKYLNYQISPQCLNHIVDIIHWGNWSQLVIQLETNGFSNIDFYNPWSSVLVALQYCIYYGFFTEPLSNDLYNCIQRIYFGWLSPISFFHQFMNAGIFTLDEYELYFDFYGYNPFFKFDEECFIKYKNSVYTNDYAKIRRPNGESKGVRRSLFCYYNKGKKIRFPYQLNRLEIRICDSRAKAILCPNDIYLSVPYFIELHGEQIKKTLKRYIKAGSIDFDK